MKILVVDDEPLVRTLLSERLAAQGHQVITASGGDEACLMVERERPDTVLLDVMMPGLDGYEVCRRIRTSDAAHLPVYLVTALGDKASRLRGFEAGADDFLTKPVDWSELQARFDRDQQLNRSRRAIAPTADGADQLAILSLATSGVAHDLSSYLSGMKRALEAVVRDGQQPDQRLAHVLMATDEATALMRQMKDLARFSSRRETVDVNERIRQLTPLLRHLAGNATVRVDLAKERLLVRGNPLDLGRALINLVSNAADAVPQTDGEIAVRTFARIQPADPPDRRVDTTWCVIQVSDNGTGIAPEHAAHVFSSGFTTKTNRDHSGLGLAVVQHFASSHGGFVSLSAPMHGGGATLSLEFPCVQEYRGETA